ncbi:hypothetical protein QAD02_022236 [Eretmocerus hayati]|uniref:Uncharacterized protein n=1 Tax=Eretmocerus hayati TaxID=131215 RepID=A0ACC2PVQ9_9HYME|nr:hypothetical protein QAD02_022236 [Eretmocerus hayati]
MLTTSSRLKHLSTQSLRAFSAQKKAVAVKNYYRILGVTEDCDDETLRLAFVNLVKKFHPDSGSSETSASRFSEVETAYRQIQRHRYEEREKTKTQNPDAEEFDIEHTAPQHRHYLVHDCGLGTPSARQRRYAAERAQTAVQNVMEHRLKKLQAEERSTLVGQDKRRARDIKTRYGMDRLVEDLIQEAMSRGEFSDLPGIGKPLKNNASAENPYVDFVTHKLNQVLIDNGFTPEWIQLSKEIRQETDELKKLLTEARNRLGELPLTDEEKSSWDIKLNDLKDTVKRINNKIDKYNLLVPILQKQMLQVNLKSLASAALAVPPDKSSASKTNRQEIAKNQDLSQGNIIQLITSIFNR